MLDRRDSLLAYEQPLALYQGLQRNVNCMLLNIRSDLTVYLDVLLECVHHCQTEVKRIGNLSFFVQIVQLYFFTCRLYTSVASVQEKNFMILSLMLKMRVQIGSYTSTCRSAS